MVDTARFKSHAAWWRAAGVETAVAERPVRWLGATEVTDLHEPDLPIRDTDASAHARSVTQNPAPPIAEPAAWPEEFDDLRSFLADSEGYPGSGYGRRRALPQGAKGAKLGILTDFPSASDIEASLLFTGAEGDLLDAMLAAAGIERGDCYILSLATTRPASGEFAEEDQAALTAFARHHLMLAAPRHVLLLGDAASRLVLGAPMLESRGALRMINHNGADMAASNCFHPRTLLARPGFKKQAWRDLQLLMRELGL